jgi:hypothetical protein
MHIKNNLFILIYLTFSGKVIHRNMEFNLAHEGIIFQRYMFHGSLVAILLIKIKR